MNAGKKAPLTWKDGVVDAVTDKLSYGIGLALLGALFEKDSQVSWNKIGGGLFALLTLPITS